MIRTKAGEALLAAIRDRAESWRETRDHELLLMASAADQDVDLVEEELPAIETEAAAQERARLEERGWRPGPYSPDHAHTFTSAGPPVAGVTECAECAETWEPAP